MGSHTNTCIPLSVSFIFRSRALSGVPCALQHFSLVIYLFSPVIYFIRSIIMSICPGHEHFWRNAMCRVPVSFPGTLVLFTLTLGGKRGPMHSSEGLRPPRRATISLLLNNTVRTRQVLFPWAPAVTTHLRDGSSWHCFHLLLISLNCRGIKKQ